MQGRVLVIAGSDSGGGAGIQADIKTITALGGYAETAITALTAQNTLGVEAIFTIPPDFIARQMAVVLDDIGADVIKTGMLYSASVIEAVAATLQEKARAVPLVVDPVMIAKGGAKLLEDQAIAILKNTLVARAGVLTPNIPEAEILTSRKIINVDDMVAAAQDLLELGPHAVLLTGGHLSGDQLTDVLVSVDGVERFEDSRIQTRHTHGTGCTLASAIAIGLAQGMGLRESVMRARAYVRAAISRAPGYGHGHGPINHAVTVRPDSF